MKLNRLPSSDEFHVRAGLQEKGRNIDGGSAGAQHGDLPALKSAQIAVLRTMRDHRGGNRLEQWRYKTEIYDAGGHHDLPRPRDFAGGCRQFKESRRVLERDYLQVFQFRRVAHLKITRLNSSH